MAQVTSDVTRDHFRRDHPTLMTRTCTTTIAIPHLLISSRLMSPFDRHDDKMDGSPVDTNYFQSHVTISPDGSERILHAPSSHSQRRFVAGASFFNYNAYGSLRPFDEPIQLFSSQYFGLAVHSVVSGFAFFFFSYGYGQLLAVYLKANSEQQVYAAYYVLMWPSALSIVIGLCTDSFTTCGYRRKGYMLLGWVLSLVMYIIIFMLDVYHGREEQQTQTASTNRSPFALTYLTVSLTAAFGIQISWHAGVAASVEYAQREHVYYRGSLQATLVALYYTGGVVARLFTAIIVGEDPIRDTVVSVLSMGGAAIVLIIVMLGAIPLVVCFFHEDPLVHTHPPVLLRDRLATFWKFCHQKVVYRVLFFTTLHLFLIGLFNQNVRDAVLVWSRVNRKESVSIEVVRMVADVASVLVWKVFFRNVRWRTLVVRGTLLYIGAHIILTVTTTVNIVRSDVFYTIMLLIAEIPRTWLLLFTFILAAEIADAGYEGATVTLAMSFQALAALADYTLAIISPDLLGNSVTNQEILQDTWATRGKVLQAFAIVVVINVLCLLVVRLLPDQKLDAQQQRAFGGYNKYARGALLAMFVVLLCFNLAVNLMAVL